MDRSGIVRGAHGRAKRMAARNMRRTPTPAERALWQRLRAGRLDGMHFRRQQVIDGFIVDFYCHVVGLVIEVDGTAHELQRDHDAERDRILSARGLLILRFSNAEVLSDTEAVVRQIRVAVGK